MKLTGTPVLQGGEDVRIFIGNPAYPVPRTMSANENAWARFADGDRETTCSKGSERILQTEERFWNRDSRAVLCGKCYRETIAVSGSSPPKTETITESKIAVVTAPAPSSSIADAEMMDVLRNVVAPKATDSELKMLAMLGHQLGLDVLRGQVKYADIGGRGVIMVGIDGFRAIAEATGEYDGQDPPEYVFEGNKLVSATVRVYRKGMSHPISATAFYEEYARPSSPIWARMSRLMLSKVAESLALRKAFPRGLANLYEPSEMDQARAEDRK